MRFILNGTTQSSLALAQNRNRSGYCSERPYFSVHQLEATVLGLMLAVASGAIATGFGYIVWYLALQQLSAARAATVQLSMPVLVALAGAAFLAEPLTVRLLIASAGLLGGIALVFGHRLPGQRP